MRCPACGIVMHDKDEFCRRCGSRTAAGEEEKSGASPIGRSGNPRSNLHGSRDVDDPEVVLWEGNYSVKSMFRELALAILLTVAIPVVTVSANGQATNYIVPAVAVIWLLLAGLTLFRKVDEFYRITNQRLIHEKGIFYRRINRIEVIDIDDLRCEQGLIERMLGVGRIIVGSSDRTHPLLVINGLDRVRDVTELLDDARRRERLKHGLYIESI